MTPRELILQDYDIPAVPMVAVKILRLIDDPKTMIDDLQRAIMADQGLATRVLKMANSAFYGVRHNVDTISEAIAIMGFNAIRNLTLAVATREVYKRFGLIEQKLWEHSLGVSIASGIIASIIPSVKNEEAVVAGLLHDVGKVIMNNAEPERFALLTQRVYEERATYSEIEEDIFGFTHAQAGYILAEKWGFPEVLCDVIRYHHECYRGSQDDDPYTRMLCGTVAMADAICVRLGVGYRGPMADLNLHIEELGKMLDINEDRREEIIRKFKLTYVEEKMSYQI
ncbi:MAG: HDOD domain-containing protein [Thermodesulfovibrionales bacterium]